MDSLPVELLRLIFQFCDPDAVKALRETSGKLAELGYEYLVPPIFRSLPWRDDVKRLHAISSHDRLRASVQTVIFDFSCPLDLARFQAVFLQDPAVRQHETATANLQDAREPFRTSEPCPENQPSFADQAHILGEAFLQLPNLSDVKVIFNNHNSNSNHHLNKNMNKIPHDGETLGRHRLLDGLSGPKMDRRQICANLNAIVQSLSGRASISSLEIDRLPMELFKIPQHRQHWFKHSPAMLAGLRSLDITVDPSEVMLPAAKFRAINGLGHFLQFATSLERLSLSFHNHSSPRHKFSVWFKELFGANFAFKKLTDLKLEGLSCDEHDLRRFLERHGPTLKRLRLGGDWVSGPGKPVYGGIQLGRGTFRSLFTSLQNRLPHLERVHLSGHFECGMLDPSSHEKYDFWPVMRESDDSSDDERGRTLYHSADDGLEFERYLLRGGEYPGTPARSPSPQSA